MIFTKGGTRLSPVRILVADDCADWRRQIRLLLEARTDWQIICEIADGSEAVAKAEQMRPHLILLDIGLPNLNGIEAARLMNNQSPASKILFVSLHDSRDVVQAALSTGALGYVAKSEVRSQLLPAIEAVLQGRQFVSAGLKAAGPLEPDQDSKGVGDGLPRFS
jgi:DNA-binding NarL/FixJ family response regulator